MSAISILLDYPILTLSAHVQRTAGVLPPPFPGPKNQIDYGSTQPLGTGTNVELQDGPQVFHISIDDPIYAKSTVSLLKPLEYAAQIPIYLVNQSSWLWGWGGFWIIFIIILVSLRSNRLIAGVGSLYPVFIIHAIVFSLTAEALPRYLMASILLGSFSLSLILGFTFQGAKRRMITRYDA
jgi:hypothetical protein